MEVIDCHQHIGGTGNVLGGFSHEEEKTLEEEARARAAAMDVAEIDWAIVQPSHMYHKPDGIADTRRVNDTVATFRTILPDRFRLALGTVEPMQGDRSVQEVARCKEIGLDGISWHHRFQGVYIDTPLMAPILNLMADLGLVPLLHTNSASDIEAPWRMQRLAQQFPHLTFLALDAFHAMDKGDMALHLAETTPNVLWDISGPIAAWGIGWQRIENWVRRHGGERLIFGADITYWTAKPERSRILDLILASDLPAESKENILNRNIRRAFARSLNS